MKSAVYPGSFDPLTNGHLDIIERSARIFDRLNVAVLMNNAKNPLFSVSERVSMIEMATAHLPNVTVSSFDGLLAEYAGEIDANVVVRGLRAVTDFEYELQIAQTNRVIAPNLDTVFLTTSLQYAYLSSTIVKEVACYGGDISEFVPEVTRSIIYGKYTHNKL